MADAADDAADISPQALRDGAVTWATIDAPWLQHVDAVKFATSLNAVRSLDPVVILSSHLPPAHGMHELLLGFLADAAQANAFIGPDQAALEQMMAAAKPVD